jgi:cytochrome c biogenesis protein CcmG/thiol:disulfide interchange protein DsbE
MSGRARALRRAIPHAVVPVLVLLAYGFRIDPREIPSPLVGKPASRFALTALKGKRIALESLRGQVVVVKLLGLLVLPRLL